MKLLSNFTLHINNLWRSLLNSLHNNYYVPRGNYLPSVDISTHQALPWGVYHLFFFGGGLSESGDTSSHARIKKVLRGKIFKKVVIGGI